MADTIKIEIDPVALAAAVQRVLEARPGAFTPNPMAVAIVKAIAEAEPAIAAKVRGILAAFVVSPDLEQRMLAIFRDALHGEAARMGRNAARALVNEKTEGVSRG